MRRNLDATHGLIMAEAVTLALGGRIGRMRAHQLLERASHQASAEGRHLLEVLKQDAEIRSALPEAELERLFDPSAYLGEAVAFAERVLHSHRCREGGVVEGSNDD
jgi:3-carboxy-cis,cis-muconate cycloisomerase